MQCVTVTVQGWIYDRQNKRLELNKSSREKKGIHEILLRNERKRFYILRKESWNRGSETSRI